MGLISRFPAGKSKSKFKKYEGTIANLPYSVFNLYGFTVGNHAVFGGGTTTSGAGSLNSIKQYLVAYDDTLTQSALESSYDNKLYGAACCNMKDATYGFVAFGVSGSGTSYYSSTILRYNSDLMVHTTSSAFKPYGDIITANGGLFVLPSRAAGGSVDSGNKVIELFNVSTLEKLTSPADATYAYGNRALTTCGNESYVLILGFLTSSSPKTSALSAVVDVYDTENFIKLTSLSLSEARTHITAETNGEYAIALGGVNRYTTSSERCTNIVDFWDNNLNRTSATINTSIGAMSSTNIYKNAFFAGGSTVAIDSGSTNVYTYSKNLVLNSELELSYPKIDFAITTLKDYVLIAGGQENTGFSSNPIYNMVEAFRIK